MGDVDDRGVEVLVEALQLRAHLHAELGVEVRERLVHQECARIAHQRPPERHALLLAARKLARLAREKVLDVEHLRRRHDLLLDLRLWQLSHLQREGEVLVDGLVRIERVVLEDHGDVAILGIEIGDQLVADIDVAAAHRDQPGHEIERRRLAAARRADEGDELAILDGQGDVIDGIDIAVGLDHVLQDNLAITVL